MNQLASLAIQIGGSHCNQQMYSFISVYQKRVLSLLVDLRNRFKQAQPASSAVHIERMETMEDFKKEEQCLCDKKAFDTLVGFTNLEYRTSALAHC